MAPARGGGLKGLYWQRKKKPSKSTKGSKNKPQQQCTHQDAGDAEEEEREEEEEELRRFDMDMAYGPCSGMMRRLRWERAAMMGLRPPPHLRDLILLRAAAGSSPSNAPPPMNTW